MKKIFAFLMFAAALMTGCDTPTPTPTPGGGGNENKDEFYGVKFDAAEVLNRGDYYNDGTNSYIVYMYKQENGQTVRLLAGEIITPEVNDGVVPEGTYTVANGSLAEGSFDAAIEGSYYIRSYSETDYYYMLVTEGSFDVKHVEGGYQFTATFSGINLETGDAIAKTESRFTGAPDMIGLPASNNYEVFAPVIAQAELMDLGGVYIWDILLGDNGAVQGTPPAHLYEFAIFSENPETIPTGTFPIDGLGLGILDTQYGNWYTSIDAQGNKTEDQGRNGYITIKALGEGKYSIEAVSFGMLGGYKQKYEGPIHIVEPDQPEVKEYNIDFAQANFEGEYNGNTWWVLFLGDQAADRLFVLYLNTPADSNAAAGLPTGKYTVAVTGEPFTMDPGVLEGQSVSGSMIMDLKQTGVYDFPEAGEVNVTNNGDGTYAINFSLDGYQGDTLVGEYEGEVPVVDDSGEQSTTEIPLAFDVAEMYYLGLGEWIVYLGDSAQNAMLMLDVILAEDATFADGLTTGNYTIADTYDPCTIWPAYVDEEGYYGGSLIVNFDMTGVYDMVTTGTMDVENKGEGNYKFAVNGLGGNKYIITGSYEGAVAATDGTAEAVAPAKVKKQYSPLKANVREGYSKSEVKAMKTNLMQGHSFESVEIFNR